MRMTDKWYSSAGGPDPCEAAGAAACIHPAIISFSLSARGPGGYLLIDWELAGPCGRPLFWHPKALPPGMKQGDPWQPLHDLWQLGRLMQAQLQQSHPVVEGLVFGNFLTAEAASYALRGQ